MKFRLTLKIRTLKFDLYTNLFGNFSELIKAPDRRRINLKSNRGWWNRLKIYSSPSIIQIGPFYQKDAQLQLREIFSNKLNRKGEVRKRQHIHFEEETAETDSHGTAVNIIGNRYLVCLLDVINELQRWRGGATCHGFSRLSAGTVLRPTPVNAIAPFRTVDQGIGRDTRRKGIGSFEVVGGRCSGVVVVGWRRCNLHCLTWRLRVE